MAKNQKVISILRHMRNLLTTRAFEEDALEAAIQALNEVEEYRTIGTPGECRAAAEKQKPFKPETVGLTIGIGRCKCGAEFLDSKTNYCGNCGQKLNWNRRANDGKTD